MLNMTTYDQCQINAEFNALSVLQDSRMKIQDPTFDYHLSFINESLFLYTF